MGVQPKSALLRRECSGMSIGPVGMHCSLCHQGCRRKMQGRVRRFCLHCRVGVERAPDCFGGGGRCLLEGVGVVAMVVVVVVRDGEWHPSRCSYAGCCLLKAAST